MTYVGSEELLKERGYIIHSATNGRNQKSVSVVCEGAQRKGEEYAIMNPDKCPKCGGSHRRDAEEAVADSGRIRVP